MLQLESITAGYGELTVLSELNITVAEGETVCLIGPNGAGKSTVLRVVAGQLIPKKGTVRFNNQDISKNDCTRKIEHGDSICTPGTQCLSQPVSAGKPAAVPDFYLRKTFSSNAWQRLFTTFPWMQDKLTQSGRITVRRLTPDAGSVENFPAQTEACPP